MIAAKYIMVITLTGPGGFTDISSYPQKFMTDECHRIAKSIIDNVKESYPTLLITHTCKK